MTALSVDRPIAQCSRTYANADILDRVAFEKFELLHAGLQADPRLVSDAFRCASAVGLLWRLVWQINDLDLRRRWAVCYVARSRP